MTSTTYFRQKTGHIIIGQVFADQKRDNVQISQTKNQRLVYDQKNNCWTYGYTILIVDYLVDLMVV